MKIGKLGSILPAQSLLLTVVCGAALLAFVLLVILPAQRLSSDLDRNIEGLQARIDEQKILSPVFKNLFAKTKAPEPKGLPDPARTKLTREEIVGVPKRLHQLATVHKFKVREIVPEINTLTDASGRFLTRLTATGPRKENVNLQGKVERIREALDAAGTYGENSLLIKTIDSILDQ